jgi:hypothetical protein
MYAHHMNFDRNLLGGFDLLHSGMSKTTKKITINVTFMDRASLDMEILYMTKKMRHIMIFIIHNALHVSDVYHI